MGERSWHENLAYNQVRTGILRSGKPLRRKEIIS
jgi:hypothetical protein